MGCWGITAFESDAGLDAVGFIRKNLPKNGELQLGKILEKMQKEQVRLPAVEDAESHTGPMALAETIVKFINKDMDKLDYDEDWATEDNKFGELTSFIADKESIKWLRDYISDSLENVIEYAKFRAQQGSSVEDQCGGWFEEKNWIGWQKHMSELVERMDTLLASEEDKIELIQPQEQTMQM